MVVLCIYKTRLTSVLSQFFALRSFFVAFLAAPLYARYVVRCFQLLRIRALRSKSKNRWDDHRQA